MVKQTQNQIHRIAGQIKGIEKMVLENRDVLDIVTQIQAIRSALSSLAIELLKKESKNCVECRDKNDKLKKFEDLVASFFKVN